MKEEKIVQPVEEAIKAPKKRRRTSPAAEVVAEPVHTTPEVIEEPVAVEEPTKPVPAAKEAKKSPEPAKKARRKPAKPEIDEAARDARAQLKAAAQSMKLIRGMVEMVEIADPIRDPDKDIVVVTHYDGFRIIIPACHMGLMLPDDISPIEKAKYYKRYTMAMMAAEFDYVVVAVDNTAKVAIGNRQIAMGIERKRNYVNPYKRTGKSLMEYSRINELPVTAKVMAVSGTVVRLDVGGCEAIVRAKDAAWRYTSNLSELFHTGQEVKVIVKEIEHSDKGWRVEVSIREATPNNQMENAKLFKQGSICVGTVSGATGKGYFIAIGDNETGIDAFCGLVHGEVPQIGDKVTCLLTKVDTEKGYALAKITRILQKASRNHF